jgi:hypothetical protein
MQRCSYLVHASVCFQEARRVWDPFETRRVPRFGGGGRARNLEVNFQDARMLLGKFTSDLEVGR